MRRQLGIGTGDEVFETRGIGHHQRRIGVGDQGVALGRQQGGIEQHGDHTPARRAQHAQQESPRRRHGEHDPVPTADAGALESTRHPALGRFRRGRLEDVDDLAHVGTGSSSALNTARRATPIDTMTANRITPDATVTARIPTTCAMAPCTTAPTG